MHNYFILDGVDSREFGIFLGGQGTFGAPSKAYNYHNIPGRNGALIGTEKRFNNIEVTYPALIYKDFKQNISDFRNFLLSRDGYVRLEDTFNRDEYRLASYSDAFELEVTKRNDAGKFDITFNCKPQRWLASGEIKSEATSSMTLTNPTLFRSKPLVRVYGYGYLFFPAPPGFNRTLTVEISDYSALNLSYIDIDCETMRAYNGDTLLNSYVNVYVELDGHGNRDYGVDYPTLPPGTLTVSKWSGVSFDHITKFEIIPRWWKL